MCLLIAKLTFLVKMHDFLATPLFTETIPQGVLIIIEGGQGPIHYQAKGKKCACPSKWIFNTSKIG